MKNQESAARANAIAEEAKLNRQYFLAFGTDGMFVDILDDLVRKFESRSLVGKSPITGMVDDNQTLVNCGAYEFLSHIKQRINFGEQSK